MEIESIMSKDLVVCQVDDSIDEVAILMKENDIGFIPIADDQKIVGVITDRDIVINAVSNNADLDSEVEKYMTKNIISIDKKQSVEDAIELMGKEKIKRLLVTDDEKVVGVLSLSDIINKDVEEEILLNTFKRIWEIYRNIDEYQTEIDEFYL